MQATLRQAPQFRVLISYYPYLPDRSQADAIPLAIIQSVPMAGLADRAGGRQALPSDYAQCPPVPGPAALRVRMGR